MKEAVIKFIVLFNSLALKFLELFDLLHKFEFAFWLFAKKLTGKSFLIFSNFQSFLIFNKFLYIPPILDKYLGNFIFVIVHLHFSC